MTNHLSIDEQTRISKAMLAFLQFMALADIWKKAAQSGRIATEDRDALADIGYRLGATLSDSSEQAQTLISILSTHQSLFREMLENFEKQHEKMLSSYLREKLGDIQRRGIPFFDEALKSISDGEHQQRQRISVDISGIYQEERPAGDRVSRSMMCNIAAGIMVGSLFAAQPETFLLGLGIAAAAGC